MPTTIDAIADGFEARRENSAWPGQWLDEGTASTGLTVSNTFFPKPDQNLVGFFLGYDWRYKSAVRFGPVNLSATETVSQFDLKLNISEARKRVDFRIRAVLDSTVNLGPSALPSNQQLTTALVSVSSSNFADYNPFDYWTINNPIVTINVAPLVQEVIQQNNWASGNNIWFVIDFYDLGEVPGANGWLYFYALEHPTQTAAQVTYEAGVAPSITSVGGDDSVVISEVDVPVVGTNLSEVTSIKIVENGIDYPQTIISKTDTLITFTHAGSSPAGASTFVATYDGQSVSRAITMTSAATQPTTGNPSCVLDGFEYVDQNASFPGTWVSRTNDAAHYNSISNRAPTGLFFNNKHKSSYKIGPINIPRSTTLSNFNLLLNVGRGFADMTLNIQAVADPTAADIGASNVISSQTLTTAAKVQSARDWSGHNPSGYWVQDTNPIPVDVLAVAQEVINHANWVSGGYIQFVVDYNDVGGNQGVLEMWTRESATNDPVSVSFAAAGVTSITSVSGDNIIDTTETNIEILGQNFGTITNLNISKGGISENQTVKSSSSTSIIFDLTLGAIVVDTGYTLSFDSNGTGFTTTIEVEPGGGQISAGSDIQVLDGHEYSATAAPTPGGTVGTYEGTTSAASQSDFMNDAVVCGITGFNIYFSCHFKYDNIEVDQGSTIATAKITFGIPSSSFNCWKLVDIDIYGIKDSTAADIGPSNTISSISPSALTTAKASFSTFDWTGFDSATYWNPGAEEVDISAVVEEIIADANWVNGNSIQLIFLPVGYPAGVGFIAPASTENGVDQKPVFEYETGVAGTTITSVNGSNIVRDSDTGVIIAGTNLDSATSIRIFNASYSQTQTILTNTATEITFDFVRGSLGYSSGGHTLRVVKDSVSYDFTVSIFPEDGLDFSICSGPMLGNNSIGFGADPAYVAGDTLVYQNTSALGFPVFMSKLWVPSIHSPQNSQDSFLARAYDSQDGTHESTLSTITFEGSNYFIQNILPTLNIGAPTDIAPTLSVAVDAEAWDNVTINDTDEEWS